MKRKTKSDTKLLTIGRSLDQWLVLERPPTKEDRGERKAKDKSGGYEWGFYREVKT